MIFFFKKKETENTDYFLLLKKGNTKKCKLSFPKYFCFHMHSFLLKNHLNIKVFVFLLFFKGTCLLEIMCSQ